MPPLDLYKPATLTIADRDAAPPAARADYLTLEECIARYPRLTRALGFAGFSVTEAGAAIRDYRAGLAWSGEAVDHCGGTRRVISQAARDWTRHMAAFYSTPDGHSARMIATYRTVHTRAAIHLRQLAHAASEEARRLYDWRNPDDVAAQAAHERAEAALDAYLAALRRNAAGAPDR